MHLHVLADQLIAVFIYMYIPPDFYWFSVDTNTKKIFGTRHFFFYSCHVYGNLEYLRVISQWAINAPSVFLFDNKDF